MCRVLGVDVPVHGPRLYEKQLCHQLVPIRVIVIIITDVLT